jgi:hypothetical protein
VNLVTAVGYHTHSEQLTKITNWTFLAMFFNTSIVIVLVQANFSEVGPGWIFTTQYTDYSPAWYTTVAPTIVGALIMQPFWPLIVTAISSSIRWCKIRGDKSGDAKIGMTKKYNTKKTQISAYLDLYTGPQFMVHIRYAQMIKVVAVTMTFGIGMPILFPIAALNFLVYWVLETYQITYTYQIPPLMDNTLEKNANYIFRWMPVLFFFNGYWMLNNQQIFNSSVVTLKAAE